MNSSLGSLLVILAIGSQQAFSAPTGTPPPKCNGTIIVNPPNDLTKPYYWPADWNENLDAPAHFIDRVCTFFVRVPKGIYAKLVMKGKMDGDSMISLNDDAPYNQYMNQTNLEPFFFVNNRFLVSLLSGQMSSTGTLGFKITWSNFPTATPSRINLKNGVVARSTADAGNGIVVLTKSGSRVSLVPIPQNSTNQDALRNTLVFDGPSYYANYTGNLYRIFDSGKQFLSTGNNLTIITFEPQSTVMDMFVVQDYETTKDIAQYSAVACDSSSNCQLSLDASKGKAAAISVSVAPETLMSADLDKMTTLSIYSNTITDSNLLRTYTPATALTSLPQTFRTTIRQYVISSGYANLNFSRKPN